MSCTYADRAGPAAATSPAAAAQTPAATAPAVRRATVAPAAAPAAPAPGLALGLLLARIAAHPRRPAARNARSTRPSAISEPNTLKVSRVTRSGRKVSKAQPFSAP